MKKHGFTLAEVLITLGIIGVISALTMPTFTQNTQTAKVGPSLAKAVASFENATKAVLANAEADSLSGAEVCADGAATCGGKTHFDETGDVFWNNISAYLSGAKTNTDGLPEPLKAWAENTGHVFQSKDGMMYIFGENLPAAGTTKTEVTGMPNRSVFASPLLIDINGPKEPNKEGRDIFFFYLMDDGSLVPFGSRNDLIAYDPENKTWTDACPNNAVPGDATYCAASIFDNGMKVMYK